MNNDDIIQVSIIGDKRLLKDGALIKNNGTLFNVYRYEESETIDDTSADERLNELFEHYHKISRERRKEEDLDLIQAVTGVDRNKAEQLLNAYKRKNGIQNR